MGFEFIDSTSPVDPAARQRIRRQAALGKNLGRKIHRPSRTQPPKATARHSSARISDVSPALRDPPEDDADVQEVVLPPPDDQIGNTLTQLGFRKIGPDGLVMNGMCAWAGR